MWKDYQSTKYVNQEARSSFGNNMTPNVQASAHQATPHCPPNKLVSVEKSSVLFLCGRNNNHPFSSDSAENSQLVNGIPLDFFTEIH